MEAANNWDLQQKAKVEKLTDELTFTKQNLLKISSLERLIEESYKNRNACDTCKSHQPKLESMIDSIPKLDDIDARQPYEKQFNAMREHLIKSHGFREPMHYSSRWALFTALGGIFIGLAWSYFQHNRIIIDFVLVAAVIGLSIGYIIGAVLDFKFRKNGKIV